MPFVPEPVVPTRRQVLEAVVVAERFALYEDLSSDLANGYDVARTVQRIRSLSEGLQEPTDWQGVPEVCILWWELIESQDAFVLDPYASLTETDVAELKDIIYDPRYDLFVPTSEDVKLYGSGSSLPLWKLAQDEEDDDEE